MSIEWEGVCKPIAYYDPTYIECIQNELTDSRKIELLISFKVVFLSISYVENHQADSSVSLRISKSIQLMF